MSLLNAGIGFIVYGTPVLLILLTVLVSVIEALYLKNYLTFWQRFRKLLLANFITSLLGIIFIIFLNTEDLLRSIGKLLIENFNMEKFSLPYTIAMSLAVALPNYAVTVLIEWMILKKSLSKDLRLKEVALANLISYFVLLLIWIIFIESA